MRNSFLEFFIAWISGSSGHLSLKNHHANLVGFLGLEFIFLKFKLWLKFNVSSKTIVYISYCWKEKVYNQAMGSVCPKLLKDSKL